MIDLLSSAVRLGRAALQPSEHASDAKISSPSSRRPTPNYAVLRVISRAFYGSTSFALYFWDGLSPEERERRRIVEGRKTFLIFHMKNPFNRPTVSSNGRQLQRSSISSKGMISGS
jgi:hypothetical protein